LAGLDIDHDGGGIAAFNVEEGLFAGQLCLRGILRPFEE
jgi:hypothetical protein